MSDSAITLFIPFGPGYGFPGLTFRADTMDELNALLADMSATGEDEVSKLDSVLDGVATVNAGVLVKGLGQKEVKTQAAPVTHPQAKSVPTDARNCAHGSMTWREGTGKNNKPYKGWFCPAPHGQTKCAPEFVN